MQLFIMLNHTKPPLDDVHCRKALAYAVDYKSIHSLEEVIPGLEGAKAAYGPLLETLPGFDPALSAFAGRDVEKAKAELAQCKYRSRPTIGSN